MKSEIASMQSINRIRLEFKAIRELVDLQRADVLIESDWNLKM